MWRQYCVDFCCLSSYLELQILIYRLTGIGGHWHIHKFISFFVYFLLLFSHYVQLFCDPMDCSPPTSSVHGTSQARILEWVAISFSRGSLCPRDQIQVSWIAGVFFNIWATREALLWFYLFLIPQIYINIMICKKLNNTCGLSYLSPYPRYFLKGIYYCCFHIY